MCLLQSGTGREAPPRQLLCGASAARPLGNCFAEQLQHPDRPRQPQGNTTNQRAPAEKECPQSPEQQRVLNGTGQHISLRGSSHKRRTPPHQLRSRLATPSQMERVENAVFITPPRKRPRLQLQPEL